MSEANLFTKIYGFGPVLFGIGFIAPVVATLIEKLDAAPPFGAPPIALGLIVGIAMGSVAKFRDRWI